MARRGRTPAPGTAPQAAGQQQRIGPEQEEEAERHERRRRRGHREAAAERREPEPAAEIGARAREVGPQDRADGGGPDDQAQRAPAPLGLGEVGRGVAGLQAAGGGRAEGEQTEQQQRQRRQRRGDDGDPRAERRRRRSPSRGPARRPERSLIRASGTAITAEPSTAAVCPRPDAVSVPATSRASRPPTVMPTVTPTPPRATPR